jgi:hypothetical protein
LLLVTKREKIRKKQQLQYFDSRPRAKRTGEKSGVFLEFWVTKSYQNDNILPTWILSGSERYWYQNRPHELDLLNYVRSWCLQRLVCNLLLQELKGTNLRKELKLLQRRASEVSSHRLQNFVDREIES